MQVLCPNLCRQSETLVLALLSGSCLIAQSRDSARINDLLQQAKSRAVQANHDAELIESFTRSGTSRSSQATQLESMKTHINSMGKMLVDLVVQDARLPAKRDVWRQDRGRRCPCSQTRGS